MADPTGYVIDDELASGPLAALGWDVETVAWDDPGEPWQAYDLAVIRSTWDYHRRPEEFLAALERIERSGTAVENRLSLVRWNLDKSYLSELGERGVPIVPTSWRDRLGPGDLDSVWDELDCDEIVLKPRIGASAEGAVRLSRRPSPAEAREIESLFADRALLAQPFVTSVLSEGETSLFYFAGRFSHAVGKRPAEGDYRVQEEHGGSIESIAPDSSMMLSGQKALTALGEPPLYARIDLVRSLDGDEPWVMEVELIEPSLYLRTDETAPHRFAEAVDAAGVRRMRPS